LPHGTAAGAFSFTAADPLSEPCVGRGRGIVFSDFLAYSQLSEQPTGSVLKCLLKVRHESRLAVCVGRGSGKPNGPDIREDVLLEKDCHLVKRLENHSIIITSFPLPLSVIRNRRNEFSAGSFPDGQFMPAVAFLPGVITS